MVAAWELPEALQHLADCGDMDAVNDIMETYMADTAGRLLLLGEAMLKQDRARLRAQAHAIKGSSEQVGAIEMAAFCLNIELLAPEGPPPELIRLVARCEIEFERLRQVWKKHVAVNCATGAR
jgi:HPt (histidine-containing phosphotransfer) domain-containing protein